MIKEYSITPIPKPRMTIRDRWTKRRCVLEYRYFCDECRLNKIVLPLSGAHITFILPMPESWPKKKKIEMDGRKHQSKPDVDNLLKAVNDALYSDDSKVWDIRATKRWGYQGKIIIETVGKGGSDASLNERRTE